MPRVMPKFTKTPPDVVAAFGKASPSRGDIERRTMFSYPALFVNGNMFAFTFGPKIAVRADEATRAKPGMKRFAPMPGRPMGEYVEVPAKDMSGPGLERWMSSALAYADTLEPKAKKAAAKKSTTKKSAAKTSTAKKGAKKGAKK